MINLLISSNSFSSSISTALSYCIVVGMTDRKYGRALNSLKAIPISVGRKTQGEIPLPPFAHLR
nr:MAG TPA: hypothetical protein [Bacteriophage sp.]